LGAEVFDILNNPVDILGIVENMGLYTDPASGQTIVFFGEGGGRRIAERLGVPFLGAVPLDPNIREGSDAGKPIVAQYPDSPAAQMFKKIAKDVAARISALNLSDRESESGSLGEKL